jgi:hypothetical protein
MYSTNTGLLTEPGMIYISTDLNLMTLPGGGISLS